MHKLTYGEKKLSKWKNKILITKKLLNNNQNKGENLFQYFL